MCGAILGIVPCFAQSHGLQNTIPWGNSIRGVRLALVVTNQLISVGSTINIFARTTNTSAIAIGVADSAQSDDFDVTITNGMGKAYHLIPPELIGGDRGTTVAPGNEDLRTLPVTFDRRLSPGDYALSASRMIIINHKPLKLISNAVKVRVTAGR